MSKGIKILGRFKISDPKAFLTSSFKTGIVAFAFGAEFVDRFEVTGFTVNRKSVVIRDSDIFSTAGNFLIVVPFRVIDGTRVDFRKPERAREFFTGVAFSIGAFTAFVHGKPSVAERYADREQFGIFGISWVNRNVAIAMINIENRVVYFFYVITCVTDERTLFEGKKAVSFRQNINGNGRIDS